MLPASVTRMPEIASLPRMRGDGSRSLDTRRDEAHSGLPCMCMDGPPIVVLSLFYFFFFLRGLVVRVGCGSYMALPNI